MTKARVPKKARKLVFNKQEWYWKVTKHTWDVIIWAPDGEKYVALGRHILGKTKEDWYQITEFGPTPIIYPGDIRKYIQEHITRCAPEFDKDASAELGKLYVYKHKNHDSSPNATIHKVEPTGFRTAHKFLDHLSAGKPVFLIQHWVDIENKVGYYKVLVESYMVTFKIEWPRTWSGSFVLADPEKSYD